MPASAVLKRAISSSLVALADRDTQRALIRRRVPSLSARGSARPCRTSRQTPPKARHLPDRMRSAQSPPSGRERQRMSYSAAAPRRRQRFPRQAPETALPLRWHRACARSSPAALSAVRASAAAAPNPVMAARFSVPARWPSFLPTASNKRARHQQVGRTDQRAGSLRVRRSCARKL